MEISNISVDFFKKLYQKIGTPYFHVVMGSGFGDSLKGEVIKDWNLIQEVPFSEVPGLVSSSAPGHKGVYKFYSHKNKKFNICLQQGRIHGYEGLSPSQVVQTVVGPRIAGTEKFILTNAAGGLKLAYPVGSVLILKDHVNLTGQNPLVGPNPKDPHGQIYGPRFPDQGQVYKKEFREKLKASLSKNKLVVNEGVYLGLLGPTYETPSEVKLFAQWGLDAVGMSTVWEAIALRYLNTHIAGLSLISNHACGLTDEVLTEEDVLKVGKISADKIMISLLDFISEEHN